MGAEPLSCSVPHSSSLAIAAGNVTFTANASVTLSAVYVVVQRTGVLWAGSPSTPHPAPLAIVLNGTRETEDLAVNQGLDFGAKVREQWLAASAM